jgi:ADP-ribose pyrophosphatase
MDEEVHVYLATGLRDAYAEVEENERIELVPWPLDDLAGAIAATRDAKTLLGLLMLERRLRHG